MKDKPTRILRLPDVEAKTGFRKDTIYRLEREGRFPRRRKLTERSSGWIEAEVDEWIASRPAASAARTRAAADVIAERRRQIEVEGWTPKHDDDYTSGELAAAAGCYALEDSCADIDSRFPRSTLPDGVPMAWPWLPGWWKPGDRRRNLVKAAALLLAEIERLDRAALEGRER